MAKRSNSLIPAKGQTDVEVFDAASDEITLTAETNASIQRFMGGVVAFFATAKELERKASVTLMAAKTLQAPHDAGSDAIVQSIVRRATAEKKVIDELWHPITSTVNNFHRWLTSRRGVGLKMLEESCQLAQPLHNAYVQAEQRRVAEENERRRVEQERLAWEQRQRELAELERQALAREEAAPELSARERSFVELVVVAERTPYDSAKRVGYANPDATALRLMSLPKIATAIASMREAIALRQQAAAVKVQPLQVAEVAEVKPDVSRSAGWHDRTTWRGEVLDEKRFIAAVIAGEHQIPSDVLMVNQVKLNDYARALKEHLSRWPGVKAIPTTRTI